MKAFLIVFATVLFQQLIVIALVMLRLPETIKLSLALCLGALWVFVVLQIKDSNLLNFNNYVRAKQKQHSN